MRTRLALLAAALLVMSVAAYAADPHVGTWNLNAAKSKFSPGPSLKSGTLTIEPWGADGIKISVHMVPAEGQANHVEYSAKFDGKDYPQKGNPAADTVALKKVDANTITSTNKKGGQVVVTMTSTVSSDGKTRTTVQKGKTQDGKDMNNTLVFDKK